MILSGIGVWLALLPAFSPGADDPLPAVQVVETPAGVRIGIFGQKPAAPKPTVFVFAGGIEDIDKTRLYSDSGRYLASDGWLTVTVDIPCHGRDVKPGEPAAIDGWAQRARSGEDVMGPFVERCRKALDYLVAEKFTDVERVAACGTSRGGLCAMHFAAAEPRVRAVTCISPVTNPLALREFQGVNAEQVKSLAAVSLAERLAGRPILLTIGNDDARVSTDDCIATARNFVAAARRKTPAQAVVPVEILVGPSDGHSAVKDAYRIAAEFIRRTVPAAATKP